MKPFSLSYNPDPKVYVIHENPEWVVPLFAEFEKQGVQYVDWFINNGSFDLNAIPPEGIFYNRMSASSHTRDHRFAVELVSPIIDWLEGHGRKVINGHQTIAFEVSKVKQYIALQKAGIKVPTTYVANHMEQVVEMARNFEGQPFIVKPNRGGKGLGVQLFHSIGALETFLSENDEAASIDGIWLIQEYIKPPKSEIVRMEFINSQFYYAVAVDTSEGFELCPADACIIGDDFCPTVPGEGQKPKFQVLDELDNPDIPKLEAFLKSKKIDIAGIEFVMDQNGQRYVYDINTNTNYNREAEIAAGDSRSGMRRVAQYLSDSLDLAYDVAVV